MNFQMVLLIVAFITFVLSMVVMGYLIYSSRYSMKFPPDIADCPDYWIVKHDGCHVNPNGFNQGSFTGQSFSFKKPLYRGSSGLKEKCKWANKYNIVWDTVTNNPLCN